MKRFLKTSLLIALLPGLFLSCFFVERTVAATCDQGTGEPPFLSFGVQANLLLLLDNSGSMLDLAYVDEVDPTIPGDTADQCYDESFDAAGTYSGYFESSSWYSYDFITNERFELEAAEPAVCTTADYHGVDAAANNFVCLTLGGDGDVTSFVATGNFMNWLSASKFDIQKKILTGGKYDSVNENLQLESRGCMGDRFVKQIALAEIDNQSNPYMLPLAVRPARELYPLWFAKGDYVTGDIVSEQNVLYIAQSNITGNPTNDSPETDAVNWTEYWGTRWKAGQVYAANTAVYSMETDEWYWTQEGGTAANVADITLDTDVTWVVYDGTIIEVFQITVDGFNDDACQQVIDMLSGDPEADEADEEVRLGTIKQLTEECMGFEPGGETLDRARKSSFNHAMQECWYYDKFGIWQPGGGTVSSLKNSCENVYLSIDPWNISPFDSGYICSGSYLNENDKSDGGYIGRCWETANLGTGCVDAVCPTGTTLGDLDPDGDNFWSEGVESYTCVGTVLYECATSNCNANNLVADKPQDWAVSQTCDGSIILPDLDQEWTNDDFYYFDPCPYDTCMVNDAVTTACPDAANTDCDDWTCADNAGTEECFATDVSDNGDRCVDQAIKDFCNIFSVVEVIDPSDAVSSTGEIWNMPAFLLDGGIEGQLESPIAIMRGYVYHSPAYYISLSGQNPPNDTPEGILHGTADDLRIGAMAFNAVGSRTECTTSTTSPIEEFCPDDPDANKDGAQVISGVKLGSLETDILTGKTHVDDLTEAINAVRATSWTPLAEAVYNAIGYFTQKDTMRINATDFSISDADDPVTNWCQENHLLIITEGASTADVNDDVVTFAAANPDADTDTDVDINGDYLGTCDDLLGSTYLDDLTSFAQFTDAVEADAVLHEAAAKALYGDTEYLIDGEIRKDITTHIVVTGTPRGEITDTDECSPAKLMFDAAAQGGTDLIVSANAEELEQNLLAVLADLRNRASAGSAASVISSARGGEGAIYQAIFWPEKKPDNAINDTYTVDWAGDVHGLFIDSLGLMYEDTDGDGQKDAADKQITVYYDEDLVASMACYGTITIDVVTEEKSCSVPAVKLEDVKFLWEASAWLNDPAFNTAGNRAPYLSDSKERYLYTWNDLNNDGIVQQDTEWIPFEDIDAFGVDTVWSTMTVSNDRSTVLTDFDAATDTEVNKIVKWIRGADDLNDPTLRSRLTTDRDGNEITWRLGDVIHSTPMTVSSPAEGYHLLYNDFSYAQFFARWKQRRHVVYFGGNDGMLHAVNAGYYHADTKSFCRELNDNYSSSETLPPNNSPCLDTGPELGAELWGYVPYNQLPHLKCLTSPDYVGAEHKYYVDLRPRIFDAQIFEEEQNGACDDKTADSCKHPNGWGTILVGGQRLGGVPVDAATLTNAIAADPRQFISSYFVFDITDPENPPVLLGETTRWLDGNDLVNGDHVDLGHSTNISTMVIMKKDGTAAAPANAYDEVNGSHNQWYLMLGSGPHGPDALKGVSDQDARVAIVPLDRLVTTNNTSRNSLRIPAAAPTVSEPAGTIELPDSANGFTSDLITIDADINPSKEDYMADAVYFGTVEGDFAVAGDGTTFWDGGGRMYRLLTRGKSIDPSGGFGTGWFFGISVTQEWTTPFEWEMTTLINNGQPITAAATVGFDNYNYWVYFGTGRFLDADDKTDATQQSYYGIKEPMRDVTSTTAVEWLGTTVVAPTVHGDPPAVRTWPNPLNAPGNKGLLKTDEIRVAEADSFATAALSCRDDALLSCVPDDMKNASKTSLVDLVEYIAGTEGTSEPWANSADGWYYDFFDEGLSSYNNRERNVGQATLFGELLLFTTYQPYSDSCKAEGEAYLYGVYYQTGTAWNELIFGEINGRYDSDDVREKRAVGGGFTTTPNLHTSSDGETVTAFLQSSTGEIIPIETTPPGGGTSSGRTGWKECVQ